MKLKNKIFSRKSLFLKYMNVSVLVIFLSFLILGIILTLTISSYWNNEKHNALTSRAKSIAEYIHSNIKEDGKDGFTWVDKKNDYKKDGEKKTEEQKAEEQKAEEQKIEEYINQFLHVYADDVDSDIIVVDRNYTIRASVSENKELLPKRLLQTNTVSDALNRSSTFGKGTLDGVYSHEQYIATKNILSPQNDSVVGAVIISTDTKDIDSFTKMVMQIFILAAIATLSMSILAIGLFSYNMVKPLKQMAKAAKQFGKGDFSVRVTVGGNDEVRELATAFNNMAESLLASENIRKSFVANVSHELKTPMTTIAGFIDGILDGTIPADKQDYYLHIVSEEIKRLSRLVRSMLDLSRIDSGELKLNYQRFDLLEVLVNVILTFEREIDRKNIEIRGLDSISPKFVYGDKDLLHQVIYNLIENAVKFTNDGGYIDFDIIETQDETVFFIKNSGLGIKTNELEHVFERFYKTDKSRSKDKKGLGLGLYLVRSIIRLHGGDIMAKSEYGEYTQFSFSLPKRASKKTR